MIQLHEAKSFYFHMKKSPKSLSIPIKIIDAQIRALRASPNVQRK